MKWFLIFWFLLPLNLFSEQFEKWYGNWKEEVHIDDFTDEKQIIVAATDLEKKDVFMIRLREGQTFDFIVNVNSVEECKTYHDITTWMLFRVDKNKFLELPMKRFDKERPLFYSVDFEVLQIEKKIMDFYIYLEEMKKGKTFRVRVKDTNYGCFKDLTFDLKKFDKAIKQLSDEASYFVNYAIIQKELDKINSN